MKNQIGNALFLVLIAVALFAALSYALTQSDRGGGNTDKELASIKAAQITQYASSVSMAIQRMQILSGCTESQISFLYDSDGDGLVETNGDDVMYNPNAPSNACLVFNSEGGGIIPQFFETSAGTSTIFVTGQSEVWGIGEYMVDELIFLIRNLDEQVCIALNKGLGISDTVGLDNIGSGFFTGTYDGSGRFIGDSATYLRFQESGCYEFPAEGGYQYYQVLIAR